MTNQSAVTMRKIPGHVAENASEARRLLSPRNRGAVLLRSRRFKPLSARQEGSTLIEFAVTLPVMFMLLFMFMELCLMFYTHDMISEVAREGTRYAMVRGASCPNSTTPTCQVTASQVNDYVNSIGWPNIGGGTMTVNTTYPDGNESVGSRVQVKVTYVFRITMPFVPTNSITMSSTSVMYIIQ